MINMLLRDMDKALENNAYIAALMVALTFPDICGKAEYGDVGTKKRYVKWFNEFVFEHERDCSEISKKTRYPEIDGEVIYSLRNSLLHQGTPNLSNSYNMKNNMPRDENTNRIDLFELIIEEKNDFHFYVDSSGITSYGGDEHIFRSYRISIRRLCLIIKKHVQDYYKRNEEKFSFLQYFISYYDD